MTAECHTDPAPEASKGGEEQARTGLRVVLVGRPNSGKSSLYNTLTGGNAHVGNYPGVTVDILEADVALEGGRTATVCDLPGFYSLAATVDADTDEGIARRFLDAPHDGPRLVTQVIDATQLGLGLTLTKELLRRGEALQLVVTQNDLLEADDRRLDATALEAALGVPVCLVTGRDRAARTRVLEALAAHPLGATSAGTWEPKALARSVIRSIEAGAPSTGILGPSRRQRATAALDRLLLHPLLGPVLFVGIMTLIFAAVFLVADPASDAVNWVMGLLGKLITRGLGNGLLASFLVDGVLGGAGTVLAFMPQIVILTVAMELLDATGYLARGAFLVDRVLRFMGLSGRSFLPLLMGHACAVPAISATRIIRDPRERLTTILVLPLMTCSARIPTYALVVSTFFSDRGALFRAALFVGLYFAGLLAGLLASLALRRTATKGRGLPLVLEMPSYRTPQPLLVAKKGYLAAKRFLRDVGTTILAVAAVLWVLLNVPVPGRGSPSDPVIERSVAAAVGQGLEPITRPAGFDWRMNVALVGSFGARELMVGTMGVILGVEDADNDTTTLAQKIRDAKKPDGSPQYTTRTGLSLLAFFVLACQCMSTVAAIRRETKSLRWPAFVLAYTYGVAYLASVLVYQLAGAFGIA
ncbi:MAG: ferrous iron transporter B [Polyangiaceae bacterium]|nr:ferrous iron transporter B [Polyangiaceae bacterium]